MITMKLRKKMKQDAFIALKPNWGKSIAILLILLAVTLICSLFKQLIISLTGIQPFLDLNGTPTDFLDNIPNTSFYAYMLDLLSLLLWALVLAPLRLGLSRWFYRLSFSCQDDSNYIFYYFSNIRDYFRCVWFKCNLGLRQLLWLLLFLLPGGLMLSVGYVSYIGGSSMMNSVVSSVAVILGVVAVAASIVLYLLFILRYSLADYLFFSNRDMSVSEVIRTSIAYTQGRKIQIAFFVLSFAPLFLLGVFVVPLLFVLPYFHTAFSIYARYLIESNECAPAMPEPAGDPMPIL